ncbi:MAG TPA: hypothetical protein VGK58_11370 [Lacipirellulaceae bacterium]
MMCHISRPEISAVWILVILCIALPVRADLIVYEPFDYADGDLRNEDGGEGEWIAAWHSGQGFGSGDSWQVGQPSLSYTDSGGRTLPTAGSAARADDGGAGDTEFREARTWDTADYNDDGDIVWFSFLFNKSSGHTSGNHIWIIGDAGLPNGIGMFINPTNIAPRIQVDGTVHSAGHKSFTAGEDHLVVGRISFSDSTDDEVRFWLDPELDAIPLDTALNSGAVSAALNQTNKNAFYMRQFNSPGVTMIDEIRIGTDYFSVVGATAIPEPSSFLFVGIAALVGSLYGATGAKRRTAV